MTNSTREIWRDRRAHVRGARQRSRQDERDREHRERGLAGAGVGAALRHRTAGCNAGSAPARHRIRTRRRATPVLAPCAARSAENSANGMKDPGSRARSPPERARAEDGTTLDAAAANRATNVAESPWPATADHPDQWQLEPAPARPPAATVSSGHRTRVDTRGPPQPARRPRSSSAPRWMDGERPQARGDCATVCYQAPELGQQVGVRELRQNLSVWSG
jgi:hypothetical protein